MARAFWPSLRAPLGWGCQKQYIRGRGSLLWLFTRFRAPGVCVEHLVGVGKGIGTMALPIWLASEFLCGHWNLLGTGSCLITHSYCVRAGSCCISAFFVIVLMCSLLASSCKFRLLGSVSLLRALLRDANNCIFAAEPFSTMVPWGSLDFGSIWQTWLILPVVICLSQRLSHACLSISFCTAKLRMAH